MKPLILEYAEIGVDEMNFMDITEYNTDLNLNVIKGTLTPAFSDLSCSTETFTKAQVDTTESDDDYNHKMVQFLDTRLQTRALVDETGSDDDYNSINVR
jgi:hypothetical protein